MGSDYKSKINVYMQKPWKKINGNAQANLESFAKFLIKSLTLLIFLRCESKDVKKAVEKNNICFINTDKAYRRFDQEVFNGWLASFIFRNFTSIKQLNDVNYDAIRQKLESENFPSNGIFFELYHMISTYNTHSGEFFWKNAHDCLGKIKNACNTYTNSRHFKIWSRVQYRIKFFEAFTVSLDNFASYCTDMSQFVVEGTTLKYCSFDLNGNHQKNIELPNAINEIKEQSFDENSFIQKVTIPNSVEKIGFMAFNRCINLSKVEFEEGSKLREIGTYAFCKTAIEKIKIPQSVITIGSSIFEHCERLSVVEFGSPSKLSEINSMAFCETAIEKIEIPKSVKIIQQRAFYKCKRLSTVEFEQGSELEEIGQEVFCNTNIESIKIPSSVKKIAYGAFEECKRLSNVEFEQGSELEEIGYKAFWGTALNKITLPGEQGNVKIGGKTFPPSCVVRYANIDSAQDNEEEKQSTPSAQ